MDKFQLAGYMVNLISIMESKEDGGIARGSTLGREYSRCYERLLSMIRKDEEDETRNSNKVPGPYEARAELEGSVGLRR